MTPEQQKALAIARARKRKAEASQGAEEAPVQQAPQQAVPQQPAQQMPQPEQAPAPQQAAPSFFDRVSERFAQRSSNVADLMEQVGSPETRFDPVNRVGLPSFALQTAGQTAGGILDVFSEGIGSLASTVEEAFPEQVKNLRGGMAALRSVKMPFQSPATRQAAEFTGKAVRLGAEKASELAEKYPKQAGELGAVVNLGLTGIPVKATGPARVAKAAAKKLDFTDDLILKNMTPNQRKALAARSRQVGRKVVIDLTPDEKAVSAEVAKIRGISPKNTLLKNQNIIQGEVDKTLTALDKRLATSKVTINRQGTANYIDSEVKKTLTANKLTPRANKKMLEDFVNVGKDILDTHPNTPSGMLAARREFDRLVKKAKPMVFDTHLEQPFNDVVLTVRRSMNDLIAKAEPTMGVKEALDKSSKLLTAVDAIVPKTAKALSKKPGSKLARGAESLARFSILAKTSSMVRK